MSYYILAHECRTQISRARSDHDARNERLWEGRLRDIGVRVGNMLVEMGDLEAAGRHLRTLETEGMEDRERKKLMSMQVMLWLQIGDLRAAKRCLASLFPPPNSSATLTSPSLEAMDMGFEHTSDTEAETDAEQYSAKVLHALTHMAHSNYPTALHEWTSLSTTHPNDEMISQNLSICLLYTGQFAKGLSSLQNTVEEMEWVPHHALLFNLCTFFELGSERAGGMKAGLVEGVARKEPRGEGWVRTGADFKMEGVVGAGVRA